MAVLRDVRAWMLDMDGTIFLGDRLLPGVNEFLSLLHEQDVPYVFVTNNSSRHKGLYAEKLQRLGLDVKEDEIFTSGEATALYLKRRFPNGHIYLVGTPALEDEFRSHGFTLTEDNPVAAVLGFDTTLTYHKLRVLCDLVREGLPYYATHPDLNCPVEGGFIPDIGAMIAFVEASTGRLPDQVVGKPNTPIVEALEDRTGYAAAQLGMVGDRLYTDIALGASGMTTVLVLTGETRREDVDAAPFQPTMIMEDLVALTRVYRQLLAEGPAGQR